MIDISLCSVIVSTPDNGYLNTSLKTVVYLHCRFIFDFFEAAGVTRGTCSMLMDQCNKAISFLTSDGRGYRNGNNIQKFADAIKV